MQVKDREKEAAELCRTANMPPDWILGDTRLGVILQSNNNGDGDLLLNL